MIQTYSNHVNINKHLKKHHTLQSWDSLEPSGMIWKTQFFNQRTPPHQWPQSEECHHLPQLLEETTDYSYGQSGVLFWISLNPLDIEMDHVTDHFDMKPTNPGERFCKMRCLNLARRETRSRYSGCKPASFPDPNEVPQNGTVSWCFFWLKYHEFVHFKSPNYRHVACRNQARTTIIHIWWLACVEIGMDHQTVSPSPLFKHC